MEDMIGIVIFIIIALFAVIKSVLQKSAAQQRQQSGGKPGEWEAPTDDVRKFLQQVAGVPQKQAHQAQRRQAHAKAKPAKKASPRRAAVGHTAEAVAASRKSGFRFDPRTLRSEKNLRTAIVIREIIDRPLALRPKGR